MKLGRFPAPGHVLNGLHVRHIGDRGPAVGFESGLAASCVSWSGVQSALATTASAQTYSYDRRGFGWSAPFTGDCSLGTLTDDLHAWLHALDVPGPFIIAAHSFGTFIARVYAHRFPEEVAGLVLMDPATSEEWMHPGPKQRSRLRRAVFLTRAAGVLASVGLARLGLWGLLRRGRGDAGPLLGLSHTMRRIARETQKLPAEFLPALQSHWSEPGFFRAMAAYIQSMPIAAAEAARHPTPRHMPVTVISRAGQSSTRLAEHKAMATTHIVVDGSGHWIHLDQPGVVVEAIREMLTRLSPSAASPAPPLDSPAARRPMP